MACVILPSETARLVYGYLVKENLNDIALQFLESSPYLTDCCQIVKSGYQFNTKLMGKDLQELLQEYSVIHNLVNNKVSLLCKTSLLYKRIKLRCENLPEILELILFWKYRNSKQEENPLNCEKTSNNQVVVKETEYSCNSDVSGNKISNINTQESGCYSNNIDANSVQNNENNESDSFHSKLCCETYLDKVDENKRTSEPIQSIDMNDLENDAEKGAASVFMPMQISDIVESSEIPRNSINNNNSNNENDGSSSNTNNSGNNIVDVPGSNKITPSKLKINDNTNGLTIDLNPPSESEMTNIMPVNNFQSNEVASEFESQIKIVGIEENQNENHTLGVYSKTVGEAGNVNLDNGSVVFVGSEVGNVTIDQERNQIIVIPIDYYKTQDNMQTGMELNTAKHDLIHEKEVITQDKNEIIFEGVTTLTPITTIDQSCTGKNSNVDENIITEKDFLKNQDLIYDIENELKKSENQSSKSQKPSKSNDIVSHNPVPTPVIVVSQAVIPNPVPRYRTILPKRRQPPELNPVVIVHPLLENNKDLTKTNTIAVEPKVKPVLNEKFRRKSQRQKPKAKIKESCENLNMPNIKTPLPEEVIEEPNEILLKAKDPEIFPTNEVVPSNEESSVVDVERTNEEKENLEKAEGKKTETPVFVTKRNSKRLSLSTPRRRSHIRALEFETPPKSNEERKKSRTSPKAKVEQMNIERKSVRNTLFKSPIPETSFKSPVVAKGSKKLSPLADTTPTEVIEPLNEMLIPIATRSPNTKLSDAWESLTGVGCVIGQPETSKTSPTKKMWDADLRCFIPENNQQLDTLEKKKVRKPEKNQKDVRKTTTKKVVSTKKSKPAPMTVSPSKMSLTAKRNTYSINGNEEGSPIRSLLDDLKIVTPFKDVETIRPTEETPLTKLLRENINTIDIDLSMINTPSFPPTPSIIITPDLDDLSMTGANYYSPIKDCSKDKLLKITDFFKVDTDNSNKKESKEMHEKVIDDLVSQAKEIIGMGKDNQEESPMKRRPSGKILSMVKIQMLTQCDRKLCENIPINEEATFTNSFTNQTTLISSLDEDAGGKCDLKEELEEKRKRALKKIKVVKENLSQARNRVTKRTTRKRKRSGNSTKSDKSKSDISSELLGDKQTSESDESLKRVSGVFHSTPYVERKSVNSDKSDSNKKVDNRVLDDIRQEFPPFKDNSENYPELAEKSRKKLHYVENFLKSPEIIKFLSDFDEKNPPKLFLKSSLRRFFQVFYKWLKHPHKRELNASAKTKAILEEYLLMFEKINKGLNNRNKRFKKSIDVPDGSTRMSGSDFSRSNSVNKPLSDDEERDWKRRENEKRKDEETEDGVVSTLPLKKRKSTVQQVEIKTVANVEKEDGKNSCAENVSQTQNFLQDIDVDRFLSQIHGQENR